MLACLLVSFYRAPVAAQEPAASGFTNNDYAIDLFTGPVLGAGRIVGMAGAYGAIATGIDGSTFNPAAYAERAEEEIDWFEWELTGGVWFGGLFTRNDIDNNGRKNDFVTDFALQFGLGARLQFANSGNGISLLAQSYDMRDDEGRTSQVSFTNLRFGTAYVFLSGSLVVGGGVTYMTLDVSDPDADSSLVSFTGVGGELGVLVRPAYERYRLGATIRPPVASRAVSGGTVETVGNVRMVRNFVLPKQIHVPWEVDLGVAYQFGERRTNTPWRNTTALRRDLKARIASGTYIPPLRHGGEPYPQLPADPRAALRTAIDNDREAERRHIRNQPRRYVLLSGDVLFYGRTDEGHGVAAFLTQRPEPSGRKISLGLRVGVESEIMENRLRLRGGSYLEPSRFSRAHYRPHATLGSDVRVFDLKRWSIRATATLDLAPRYFDWGLSVGLWH